MWGYSLFSFVVGAVVLGVVLAIAYGVFVAWRTTDLKEKVADAWYGFLDRIR